MHVLKYLCLAELPNKWQTDNLVSTSWSVVCLWYLGSFQATSCNKNKIDSKKDLPCLVVLWQRPQFWTHMFNEPSVRALSREWQDSVLPPPPMASETTRTFLPVSENYDYLPEKYEHAKALALWFTDVYQVKWNMLDETAKQRSQKRAGKFFATKSWS